MSDVIENRVVEMRFDNKEFESNASTSIRTLEDLDKALEFKNSSKGFEDIQNGLSKLDFSGLHDNISSIDNAFTTLAGSIERNFLDRISNGILDLGKNLWDSTIGQIQSGGKKRAMNIEQAKFKIKGLEGDWDKVYEDMDYAVSGTAYGIDEAANAAAQFMASGVETGEEMKAALRGISGVAAMTSSDYASIARVFTAAAGKGRVQAIELNRLSLRGINAAAALGKYLNATEAEVREMARHGQIDFQTFANAMDSAFGEHAKKANETFTGSLSNIRAALSRIGEIWYEPWLKNMIPVNNKIRESLNKIVTALKAEVYPLAGKLVSIKDLIADFHKFSSRLVIEFLNSLNPALDRLPYRLEHVANALTTVRHTLKSGVNMFKTFNNMLENPWDFEATLSKRALKMNKDITDEEWKLAKEMVKAKQYDSEYNIKADEKQMKLIKEKGMSLEHVQEIVDSLTMKEQKYLDGITQKEINYATKIFNSGKYNKEKGIIYNEEAKAEMQELGLDAQRVQRYLDKLTTGENADYKRNFGHVKGAEVLLYLYEESLKLSHLFTLIGQKVQRVGVAITNAFKQVWNVFHPIGEEFPSIVDFLTNIVKKFTIAGDRYKAIQEIAKGVFSIGELMFYGAKKIFTAISKLVDDVSEGSPFILNFFAKFGRFFTDLAKAIILEKGEIPSVLDLFKDAFGVLTDKIQELMGEGSNVRKFFTNVASFITTAIETIKGAITKLLNKFGADEGDENESLLAKIISIFVPESIDIEGIIDIIKGFISFVGSVFVDLLNFAKTVTEHLGEVFDFVWGILKTQGDNINNLLTALFGFFTNIFSTGADPEVFEKLKELFMAMADTMIEVFTVMKETIVAIHDPVVSLCEAISKILAAFAEGVSSVIDWITRDPEAAYGAAAFFALIDLIAKGLTSRKKKLNGLTGLKETIREFLASISASFKMLCTETPLDKLEKFANAILKVSVAIFLVMAAFTNLFGMGKTANGEQGYRENTSALLGAIATVGGFMVALFVILRKIGKISAAAEDLKVGSISIIMNIMASCILKIAIGFAIITSVIHNIGAAEALTSVFFLIAILGMLVGVVQIVMKNVEKISTSGTGTKAALKGVGTILAAVGLAVSLIAGAMIKMMLVFMALKLQTGDTNEALIIMGIIEIFMILLMGMMLLTVNIIAKSSAKLGSIKTKTLLGMAAIILVMGMVVKMVTKSILKIATFLVITKDISAVGVAFGLITLILLECIGIYWVLNKVKTGSSPLKAAAGLAIVLLMVGHLMNIVTAMVVTFHAAGIKEEDIMNVIKLMGALGILVVVVEALALVNSSTGGKVFLAISAGIFLLAAGIKLMASAVWTLAKMFIAMALAYPKIKDIIPDMLHDLKEQLPEFIETVGIAFRELLLQILYSAPLLAAVIVEVAVLCSVLFAQKAPLMVSKWLIAIDEVVTLLLAGSVVILPKLLALALIFLGYLDANAVMFGEKLMSILLKVILGAFVAIAHFLDDYLPNWIEENMDKIDRGALKHLSEQSKFYNAIGDWIYEAMEGESREETEFKQKFGSYIVYDENGKMQWKHQSDNLIASKEEVANQLKDVKNIIQNDVQQMVDEAAAEAEPIQVENETPYNVEETASYLESMNMDRKDTEKIVGDMKKAVAKANEEQKEEVVTKEEENGTTAAQSFNTSFLDGIFDGDFMSGMTDKLSGLTSSFSGAGSTAGSLFNSGFTDQLSGLNMDDYIGSFTTDGQLDNATSIMDQFGAGNMSSTTGFGWDPTTNERTGMATYDDLSNVDITGGQSVSDMTGLTNNNSESLSMLGKLKNLISDLGDKFSNSVVVSKDSNIDITATIDKTVLGETLAPVLDTINGKNIKATSRKIAGYTK